jgi:hypothetical protein
MAAGWAYTWRSFLIALGAFALFYSCKYGDDFTRNLIGGVGTYFIVVAVISMVQYGKATEEERENIFVEGTQLGLSPFYLVIIILIFILIMSLVNSRSVTKAAANTATTATKGLANSFITNKTG